MGCPWRIAYLLSVEGVTFKLWREAAAIPTPNKFKSAAFVRQLCRETNNEGDRSFFARAKFADS